MREGSSSGILRTRSRYVVAVAAIYALCMVGGAVYRVAGYPSTHSYTKPDSYDPGVGVFHTWVHWKAIDDGDFEPVWTAALGRSQDSDYAMYRPEELETYKSAFVYTPIAALMLTPIASPERSREEAADITSVANHVLAIAGALFLFGLFHSGRRPDAFTSVLFAGHVLLFYPLAKALELTQSGVWIFFFLAAAALLLDRRAHVAGGLALAVGISIKPHLILVPIGLALVGRFPRKPLVACFAGLAVTGIICLIYAGFANLRDYAFELLPHLSSGYAYYPNQSFNGMFLRLFTDQDPAVYNLSVKVPWIQKAAMASGLSLVGLAVLAGRGRARAGETEGDLLCFGGVLAAAVLASPLCWIHHYALLAIPIAIGARELHRIPSLRRGGLDLLFLASAVLLSFFFDTRRAPALLSGPELTGALVFLACTFILMRRRVA